MPKFKVLFLHATNSFTLFPEHVSRSGEYDESNDYLSDAIFLELKSREDFDVYEYPGMLHMYKDSETNINNVTGKGFFLRKKLIGYPNIVDHNDIVYKIENNFFDLIFTDSRTMNPWWNDRGLSPFYPTATKLADLILKTYDKNQIIFFDGEDQTDSIIEKFYGNSLYFKRELVTNDDNLNPIGYCFPKQYIKHSKLEEKTQALSTLIPGLRGTYIFDNEFDYQENYRQSFFGLTWKKLGWDCFRHHEIIFSSCLPIFPDLDECPEQTLAFFPKKICKEIMKMDCIRGRVPERNWINQSLYVYDIKINLDDINIEQYQEISDQMVEYSLQHLTSEKILDYILNKTNLNKNGKSID